MSLILEALRKSEAERRRGQVPTLHAERAPSALPARATRPGWPWLALAIAAVLATAWLGRGAWSPPRPDAAVTDAVARPVSAQAAIRDSDARDASAGQRDAVAAPLEPDRPAERPAPARVADPAVAVANPPALIAPPRADAPAPPSTLPGAASAGGAAIPESGVAPAPPRTAIPAAASVARPATAPDATIATAPLRLSDLSPAERLELPPLKMSMHMWDPTPAQRFAIIDGARVNEGDRLGEAVVEEITASAVVLAWRGQRLQVPMR